MRIRSRIIAGYLLVALQVAGIAYFVHGGMGRILTEAHRVEGETLPTYMFLRHLQEGGMRLVASTNEELYILATASRQGKPRAGEGARRESRALRRMIDGEDHQIAQAKVQLRRNLDAYRTFMHRHAPHETELLQRIEPAASHLLASSAATLAAQERGASAAELLALKDRFEAAEDQFLDVVEEGLQVETSQFQSKAREIKGAIGAANRNMRLGGATVFLVALLGGFLIARSLALPLEQLKQRVEDFGRQGDWGDPSPRRQDEIGDLARTFSRMAADLHRHQEALVEMRDYADRILDVMSNALAVVGPDGAIQRVNRSLCELLCLQEAELIGRPLAELVVMEKDGLRRRFAERPLALDLTPVELQLLDGRGEEIPVLFSAAPLQGANGRLLGSVCVAQDISARKKAEEEVLAGKRFLESVLNSMEDEIVIVHPVEALVLDANRAFLARLQLPREEVVGEPAQGLIHACSGTCTRPDRDCPLPGVLASRRAASCEHVQEDPDGNPRYLEVQACPILDRSGERVTEVVHVSRDVTRQRQTAKILEEFTAELEANNRLLVTQTAELAQAHAELKASQSRILQQEKMASIGQLAAGVAHEINNPMGFIISNLNALGKYTTRLVEFIAAQQQTLAEFGPSPAREQLATLRGRLKIDHLTADLPGLLAESLEGADRVKKIVQDLKSFSRVDQFACVETDLNECLESTLSIVWNELKYKATLKKEYAADLPNIPCYAQQLNQVFLNLLVNAGQAIGEQGEIALRTWQEPGWVCVAVADSGCGIPEEVQNRIFEPFFTTKEVGTGTGLGLSISYDIVKKHQGRIEVQSTPGQGTTFTIRLPLQLPAPAAGSVPGAAPETA